MPRTADGLPAGEHPVHADLRAVAAVYDGNLARHGETSEAVGWRDAASHRLRFDRLARVFMPEDGPVEVNDLGCGYGALYGFLVERGVDLRAYRGWDVSEAMVRAAQRRVPRGEFRRGSSIDVVGDIGIASGIFNVRLGTDEGTWLRHILATLDSLAATSRLGFAFNLLTAYVDWRDPQLFYADPDWFHDHCRRTYGGHVAMYADTPLYEWTITVRW